MILFNNSNLNGEWQDISVVSGNDADSVELELAPKNDPSEMSPTLNSFYVNFTGF
jgi:hypothetical protein